MSAICYLEPTFHELTYDAFATKQIQGKGCKLLENLAIDAGNQVAIAAHSIARGALRKLKGRKVFERLVGNT